MGKKTIFQKYPEVWRNLSKFFYKLGTYSFLGIVAAGFVSKEIETSVIISGGLLVGAFAVEGFLLEYLTYRRKRR